MEHRLLQIPRVSINCFLSFILPTLLSMFLTVDRRHSVLATAINIQKLTPEREGLRNSDENLAPRVEVMNNNE